MKLTKQEVQKIAELARIELKDEEIKKYRDQLSDVLGYVNKLQEVDTSAGDMDFYTTDLVNIWREDKINAATPDEHRLVLENMPDKENNQLKTIGVFKK